MARLPRISTALRTRLFLVLTVLVSSAATGPIRPATSAAQVVANATGELAAAWRQVLACGSTTECD